MKETFKDPIFFIASHFIVGALLVTGLLVYRYKTIGKLKPDDENWFEFCMLLFGLLAGGYGALGLLILFGIIAIPGGLVIMLYNFVVLNKDKVIVWSLYFIGLFALFTQCTSKRVGAHCSDGTYSYATGRGACSWHGGVSSWDRDYWWDWFED